VTIATCKTATRQLEREARERSGRLTLPLRSGTPVSGSHSLEKKGYPVSLERRLAGMMRTRREARSERSESFDPPLMPRASHQQPESLTGRQRCTEIHPFPLQLPKRLSHVDLGPRLLSPRPSFSSLAESTDAIQLLGPRLFSSAKGDGFYSRFLPCAASSTRAIDLGDSSSPSSLLLLPPQ
jgi:hypothetical protein